MADAVYKTDDTSAFGNNFITITVHNPDLYPISKILAVTNSGVCIENKVFIDPDMFQTETITLYINYSSDETTKLNQGANILNLVAYDDQNRQKTCPQTLTFYAQNGVLSKDGKPCC